MENRADHRVFISSLFVHSLKKKARFAQMVPGADGKPMVLQAWQHTSVLVKPAKISHSSIPHCKGITCFPRQLCWKDCSGRLQTNRYLQSPQDHFFSNKKCLFANCSKLTRGFLYIYIYFLICDSRQWLPEETQTEDISGKCAFMQLLHWWAIEHDSRLDWDLDSPSTAVHLGDEVLERSEMWIFLLGNEFPEIIV